MATETTISAKEIIDRWRSDGIRFVRFELPDMHGSSRSKLIPIERAYGYAEEGLNMYGGTGVLDSRSDVVPGTLYNEEVAYADQRLLPDSGTALFEGPHIFNTVRNTYVPLIEELVDQMNAAGVPIITANCEYAGSQWEINFEPAKGLEGPDRAFTFKNGVKELAHAHGFLATFMSKPFSDSAGSGCHTHVCLLDPGSGENLFGDESDPQGISSLCRRFLAGQLRHAAGMYALLAPTVNCLKRRRTHTFSPTNVSWGLEDRSAFVRIKGGSLRSRHVENRAPTAMANPYLAGAAVLAAGILGIEEELGLEPPAAPPAEEDESKPKLPVTLHESLAALEGDEALSGVLGDEFVTAYTTMRRHELQRFEDHVTDWEHEEYLEI